MPLVRTKKRTYESFETANGGPGLSWNSISTTSIVPPKPVYRVRFEDQIITQKRKLLLFRIGIALIFVVMFVIGLIINLTVPVYYGEDIDCSTVGNTTTIPTQCLSTVDTFTNVTAGLTGNY